MTLIHEPARQSMQSGRESLLARVLGLVDGRARRTSSSDLTPVSDPPAPRSYPAAEIPGLTREPPDPPGDPDDSAHPVESRLYLEAREQIKRRAWGRAQRLLEQLSRENPDGPAPLDLQSVRVVRRGLRRAARWPSDPDAHLELGRAYFDLDLGEAALGEFLALERLAPRRPEGYILATLEYIYRGHYPQAIAAWTRARALQADLPALEELLAELPG
ncbi:MAG TPA: hypothetical protein VFZ25_16140 [Chloroflexota bacterium]|nr:hypothetical protein [Chloroflexota bacterium]